LIDFNATGRDARVTLPNKSGDFSRVHPRCLADQIGDLLTLTPGERSALERLEERERPVKRGGVLVRENDRTSDLFVLRRGALMSYMLLDDGSRQILRFSFPGDLVGLSVLAYAKAPETLVALAESVVCPIDRAQFAELAQRHPRLVLAIGALEQAERAALTDRLAGVGRTSAKARIAAVLLDVRDRLRRCDPTVGDTFALGLTQEEIGDATGLTAVHVNRMLRQLEEQGLIARAAGRVTLRDEAALKRAANHVDRLTAIDLSWLPGPAA
jgi:CRP/FNR family transcriptional regulator